MRWPLEADKRDALTGEGRPRLLLVEAGFGPPPPNDCLEDWVRDPAPPDDLQARLSALAARAAAHQALSPQIDDDGVVRFGAAWVPLPPVESRLTAALIDRYGAVVGRDTLGRAGWPGGVPGRNALDVHVLRLRRRLRPLGLAIRTVRSRGYMLEASGVPAPET